MISDRRLTAVIPCYNEAKLIGKTIGTLPPEVDNVILIDDHSTDDTRAVMLTLAASDRRLHVYSNRHNRGVGATVVRGFREALKLNSGLILVMAGDAQCDPDYIVPMARTLVASNYDYVKANRFKHAAALNQMPRFRRAGNVFVTLLTKFATGYYSIFDSQNGYGVFKRATLENIDLDRIGRRYDYESTLLIELSISGARLKDVAVPAIYGSETSNIPVVRTAFHTLWVLQRGFWRRVYRKYVLQNFHPIALFLAGGLFWFTIGLGVGLFITWNRFAHGAVPSTGTVMLCVLPLFTGFQLLLTAVVLDIIAERYI